MSDKLQKAKEHAISRGGACLSDTYVNNKTLMEWKCSHIEHPSWFASFDNVMNKDSWCMLCSGKAKKDAATGLKEAQDYAASRGGKCLSNQYIHTGKKVFLEWKCDNPEHPSWTGSVDNVMLKNTWCKHCADTAQTSRKDSDGLKKAQDYATSRGGECLSHEYVNQNTNLQWKCGNPGHEPWDALPKIMKRGSWCRQCYDENRKHK